MDKQQWELRVQGILMDYKPVIRVLFDGGLHIVPLVPLLPHQCLLGHHLKNY